jgi:HAD superfamily hydrolase (TIGR01509 family)
VIAFDLDGTLSDWEAGIRAACSPDEAAALLTVLDARHPRQDGDIVDGVHYLLFVEGPALWAEVLGAGDGAVARAARFCAEFRARAYPDVEPALRALHARHRLALVTNSPRVEDDLAALGLTEWFDDVVAIPPELRKPRPEGFWHACEALGVEPAELTYVGDSYRCDVLGGLEAGVRPVWVDRWGTRLPVPEGVTRVTSFEALPDLLT